MKFDLIKYMSERLQEDKDNDNVSGPIITISRLSGCPAKTIAKKLSEELTRKAIAKGFKNVEWDYVTKEIMTESAKELEMHPAKIKYVFDYEKKSLIDDILSSHSNKYYKSDRKIRQTIARVIRNIAREGHVIIVGRGGVAITHDIPRSLHVNLEAPLEWRKLRIAEKLNISFEKAERMIRDIDKKRKHFREYFEGKNTDYTQFDICLNCMTLTTDEITAILIKAIEQRNLLK
jgi:cytidylate kinase